MNTWHVGQCVAILSVSLAAYNILPEDIHVLGFSLGAHIAGFASKHMRKTMGRPYGRITGNLTDLACLHAIYINILFCQIFNNFFSGLDPALPFFANFNNDWKLGSDDANFVDVIHTNAGSFGKIEPMGHVDFYVNGGSIQPACQNLICEFLIKISFGFAVKFILIKCICVEIIITFCSILIV